MSCSIEARLFYSLLLTPLRVLCTIHPPKSERGNSGRFAFSRDVQCSLWICIQLERICIKNTNRQYSEAFHSLCRITTRKPQSPLSCTPSRSSRCLRSTHCLLIQSSPLPLLLYRLLRYYTSEKNLRTRRKRKGNGELAWNNEQILHYSWICNIATTIKS